MVVISFHFLLQSSEFYWSFVFYSGNSIVSGANSWCPCHCNTFLISQSGHWSKFDSNCGASCVVSCPWNSERFGDRCYWWSGKERGKNWSDAEEFCQRSGGHLASVTDKQVHNYMKNKLKNGFSHSQVRWIGGKHDPENKTFAWTDCSSSDFNPGWHDGFPNNNAGGDRDCVFYTHEYKWGHKTCKVHLDFVCSIALCAGK